MHLNPLIFPEYYIYCIWKYVMCLNECKNLKSKCSDARRGVGCLRHLQALMCTCGESWSAGATVWSCATGRVLRTAPTCGPTWRSTLRSQRSTSTESDWTTATPHRSTWPRSATHSSSSAVVRKTSCKWVWSGFMAQRTEMTRFPIPGRSFILFNLGLNKRHKIVIKNRNLLLHFKDTVLPIFRFF